MVVEVAACALPRACWPVALSLGTVLVGAGQRGSWWCRLSEGCGFGWSSFSISKDRGRSSRTPDAPEVIAVVGSRSQLRPWQRCYRNIKVRKNRTLMARGRSIKARRTRTLMAREDDVDVGSRA